MLPVLGEIADAEPHGILRRPDRHGLALDDDLAAIQRIRAENRPCDLRPPRTHQTGEAEDLSSSQLEADIPDGVAAPKVADLEHHLVTRQVRNFRLRLRQAAADHHPDDRVDARRRGGDSADILAVAHHGDTVGDLLQLVHLVRDIDDADAFISELADDAEQLRDLRIVQGRRGLVHDQDLGPEGESLGDLDHLLLGDGETADLRPRVELQVHALEDLCRVPVQGVLVEQKSHGPLGLAADEDVLRGRKVVHQVELLMNDADARDPAQPAGDAISTGSPSMQMSPASFR